jgi:hypothetical protein
MQRFFAQRYSCELDSRVYGRSSGIVGRERGVIQMKKPKMPRLVALTTILSLALVASCARPVQDRPPLSSTPNELAPDRESLGSQEHPLSPPGRSYARQDLDLNSGAFRYQEDSTASSGKTTIVESPLSREVRRLGIKVPETRNWQPMYIEKHNGGLHADFIYPKVVQVANQLLRLLEKTGTADNERRLILEKFMMSLRTEDPSRVCTEGDLMALELADKYDLNVFFRPEYEAYLRGLRERK